MSGEGRAAGDSGSGGATEALRFRLAVQTVQMRLALPLPLEFTRRLEVNRLGCWVWTGPLVSGYGRVKHEGRQQSVHRIVFEAARGPIPHGLTLDHLCCNRACANPAHLEPTTVRENILRGRGLAAQNHRKTHCKHGHLLGGQNLTLDRRGARVCRECRRRRKKASYARNPETRAAEKARWYERNRERIVARARARRRSA